MAKKKQKQQTMKARFIRATHHQGRLKRYTIKQYKEYINKCERLTNAKSSAGEKKILKKLTKMKAYRLIDSQLKLVDYYYKGDSHEYYPDFVMLDRHKHIVIIEVKNYTNMADEKNRKKYLATIDYCRKYGFKYAWITENLVSREQIKRAKYDKKIYAYIQSCFKRHGKFTVIDLDHLKKEEGYSHSYLNRQITIICLAKDYFMKGDLTLNRKRLCIKRRK